MKSEFMLYKRIGISRRGWLQLMKIPPSYWISTPNHGTYFEVKIYDFGDMNVYTHFLSMFAGNSWQKRANGPENRYWGGGDILEGGMQYIDEKWHRTQFNFKPFGSRNHDGEGSALRNYQPTYVLKVAWSKTVANHSTIYIHNDSLQ